MEIKNVLLAIVLLHISNSYPFFPTVVPLLTTQKTYRLKKDAQNNEVRLQKGTLVTIERHDKHQLDSALEADKNHPLMHPHLYIKQKAGSNKLFLISRHLLEETQ